MAKEIRGGHYVRIVASIALPSFMAKLDIDIVNVSMPAIVTYFHADASTASWGV